jgi:DNA polymerase-3 subunit gamma/tau
VCESCKDLSANGAGSIDVVEIDAASHNGVDDARELRERAGFAPARDRYKIFILDEAHMVTQQGFNALLKIVEEPPEHVMFIFATTEPEKVIGTIRSRTHHYPFRLVPSEIMGPYLEKVCNQEKITPASGVLKLAMRAGGGSVRDTLSVLDQLMVGSVDGTITYESASALLGFTPEALISDAIDAVIDKDGSALYSAIEKVVVGGFEPRRFVEDLLARVRDLLVLTLAGKQAVQVFNEDTEGEDTSSLSRQAKALGLSKLTMIAQKINDTLATMSGATSPRLRLELLAAQLLAAVDEPAWTAAMPSAGAQNDSQNQASMQPQHIQDGEQQQSGSRGGFNPPAQPKAAGPTRVQPGRAMQRSGQQAHGQAQEPQAPAPSSNLPSVPETPQKPAQTVADSGGAPDTSNMSDMDLWKSVLAQMPRDLSGYVESSKVPIVEFSTNALGGKHIVFTFDTPLSQHAFALAVTGQNRSVPGLVQNEVRKVFGKTASIAPNNVAANGEAVQTVNSMSPQQRAAVKRSIALSAMKAAAGAALQMPAEEQREPRTASAETHADADSDAEAHRRQNELPNEAESPATAQNSAVSTAESREVNEPEPEEPDVADDPWAEEPSAAVNDETGTQSLGPDGAQEEAVQSERHVKHIEVPEADDEDDPWAHPEPEPTPEPAQQPISPANETAGEQRNSAPQPFQRQPMQPQQAVQSARPEQSQQSVTPQVDAEEDTYSMNDASLGASDVVDLDTLKTILDVKSVREISSGDESQ